MGESPLEKFMRGGQVVEPYHQPVKVIARASLSNARTGLR
jgi:hypothetical protein